MKQTTVVNGVTLTRAQVEEALADLNKPTPVELDTTKFPYIALPFILNGNVARKYSVAIANRQGSARSPYNDRSLYLGALPQGYEWVIEKDPEITDPTARVLLIRPTK